MKNKKFLTLFRKCAALILTLCIALSLSACIKTRDYYQQRDYLMDTVLTQRIYGVENAEDVGEQVLSYTQKCEKKFSAFLEGSEIYKVNGNSGNSTSVSAETIELVSRSLEFSKQSQNGFKVSVFPLSRIWKTAIDQKTLPTKDSITAALNLVDDAAISVNAQESSITLKKGAAIDLGATAKGYIAHGIKKIYEQNKVSGAICSLGSSAMLLYGTKPDGSDFKIGIRDPMSEKNTNFVILSLSSCLVSTSGGYERLVEIDGKKYHHIIDTKTGYPVDTDVVSATVVGQDGAYLDYLSTELFLAGFENAQKIANEKNLEVILVSSDRKIYISKGLENKTSSLSENYERVGA